MQSVSFLKKGGGLISLEKDDLLYLFVCPSIGFAFCSFISTIKHTLDKV